MKRSKLIAILLIVAITMSNISYIAFADSYYGTYPRYTGSSTSIVDALSSLGIDSSFENRDKIALANGISDYYGSAEQNTFLLELLKEGKLLNPDSNLSTSTEYYPIYTGSSTSIVDALYSLGIDSSFENRDKIALANGISDYYGSAEQNTILLNLLKQGKLIKPGSNPAKGDSSLLETNLSKINYIRQGVDTCKATSLAMTLNIITGSNTETTASMSNADGYCISNNGMSYKGSDGYTYVSTYMTDSYVGSLESERAAIETAVSNGLPIVIAVHSTKSYGTKHHWIIVVGKNGGDYLVVDPAVPVSISGTMEANVRTMSSLSYELGLTDYSQTHYGYISFTRQ